MQKVKYIVGWYSPRGFANEGANYYGTLEQWRAFLDDDRRTDNAKWFVVSSHRTIEAAKARAEKEVRISKRRIAWGEIDCTSSEAL